MKYKVIGTNHIMEVAPMINTACKIWELMEMNDNSKEYEGCQFDKIYENVVSYLTGAAISCDCNNCIVYINFDGFHAEIEMLDYLD